MLVGLCIEPRGLNQVPQEYISWRGCFTTLRSPCKGERRYPGWRDAGLVAVLALLSVVLGWCSAGTARLVRTTAEAITGQNRYVVYFLRGRRLVPVTHTSPRPLSAEQAVRAAFQALCQGPPPGLDSAVRPGCRVLRVWRTGSTLNLQMQPEDWDFVPGVPAANAWDDQVEMTVAQFPDVRQVQFWIDSHRRPGGPIPVDGRPNWLSIGTPVPKSGKRPNLFGSFYV